MRLFGKVATHSSTMMIPRSFALIAAASTTLIHASPLQYDPYTPVNISTPLTSSHPAYGAQTEECIEPIVPEDPNQAKAESMTIEADIYRKLRSMEDSTNSDIQDLENYFGTKMEVNFRTLKQQYSSGHAPSTPWASSYWPTFQDSINHAWKRGEPSPSEKYATAFGLNVKEFKNKISARNGVDSRRRSTPCTEDSDCEGRNDGSVCGKRDGLTSGYCIPGWFGICHAWAPAAILEPEPQCDVTKNGVTFHVMDIKGLITSIYDGAAIKTVFTGARFNGPDSPANKDQYGRFMDAARRDLGPGYFHIAITNIMGKQKRSFVVDVTAGAEVWNQPVRSFKVQKMDLVNTHMASMQYFGVSSYPFNDKMVHLAYVKTTFSWISEAYKDGPLVSSGRIDEYTESKDYEYLLELDADYNIIGGEWVGQSKEEHPDFLWFPAAKPSANTVTSTGLKYANVQELLQLSQSFQVSRSVALSAAIATVSTIPVQSAPLQYNPYTPIDTSFPLTASHPAYGGKLNDDCVQPVIPNDPNQAKAESFTPTDNIVWRRLRGMEDASNTDIADLEKFFGTTMELNFNTLKEKYASAAAPSAPWASSYWATYQDSINHVWVDGEASPSEKYAVAFGLDVTDFKNKSYVVTASNQYFGIPMYPFNDQMAYLPTSALRLVGFPRRMKTDRLSPLGNWIDSRRRKAMSTCWSWMPTTLSLAVNGSVNQNRITQTSWFPTGKPDASSVVHGTNLSYANVKELLELSVACNSPTDTPAETLSEVPLTLTSSSSDSAGGSPTTSSGSAGVFIPITIAPAGDNGTPIHDQGSSVGINIPTNAFVEHSGRNEDYSPGKPTSSPSTPPSTSAQTPHYPPIPQTPTGKPTPPLVTPETLKSPSMLNKCTLHFDMQRPRVRSDNPIVFLDVSIGSKSMGRLLIELRADIVPRTAENFRRLCTGETTETRTGRRRHYARCPFHRVVKDKFCQSGDYANHDGSGGECTFDQSVQTDEKFASASAFDDESFILRHTGAGVLSMANAGPDSNTCQFYLHFSPQPSFDGKHVVFGCLMDAESYEVLEQINAVATDRGDPKQPVKISKSGQLYPI
ncbi:Peptidyl-prolyl cis-trans isomerase H [Phytophthora citrophthora]|uniref:Peptidyl-prolyl cis-trans isomerase H n=1 Tax=Phytophthora citrophthora TaxID=4793 RepID=A0AAD9LIU9_9STRA|nr:Peptidyl-prolyl cis-trans isomerase H [Phytophthora citrophthora]